MEFRVFRCTCCGAIVSETWQSDDLVRRFTCPECGEEGEYRNPMNASKGEAEIREGSGGGEGRFVSSPDKEVHGSLGSKVND